MIIKYDPGKYSDFTHVADEYAKAVLSGEILACRWVKLAGLRHLNERFDVASGNRTDLIFSEQEADFALDFFSTLKLWKGAENKGKPFVLGPHYQFITSCLMGWLRTDTFTRRFRVAYIGMARKGAKSTFAGGLGAFFFVVDGESGAEIYTAAVKKEQAGIVWKNIRNLTQKSIFKKLITYHKYNLSIERTWSKCEPLASDSKSLDGLDTHFASLDELHAHPTPAVHDLIVDSTGARAQSLILIITTAGFDQNGICYQRRDYLTKILKGVLLPNLKGAIVDDSFFGIIYTLDRKSDWPDLLTEDEYRSKKKGTVEDDYHNEDLWIKAVPGLCGITKSGKRFGIDKNGDNIPGYMSKLQDIRDSATYAFTQPSALNNFLTKRLNIWTSQYTRWIDLNMWDQNNTRPVDEEKLKHKICFGGIDLSAVEDLTVWVMLFPDDTDRELVDILIRVWCPEAKLHDKKNKYKEQYQAWEREGYLKTTPGKAVDYDHIREQIRKDAERFQIDSVAIDAYFQGWEFTAKLNDSLGGTEKKPNVFGSRMGFETMTKLIHEFELRLLRKKLNHGGNPILRFMADSVAVEVKGDAKKPSKDKSQGKIDGIVGILLGLSRAMTKLAKRKSKYENQGLSTIGAKNEEGEESENG